MASKGYELYKQLIAADRQRTQEMIAKGEITAEMGRFRDDMRQDEILDEIPEELWNETIEYLHEKIAKIRKMTMSPDEIAGCLVYEDADYAVYMDSVGNKFCNVAHKNIYDKDGFRNYANFESEHAAKYYKAIELFHEAYPNDEIEIRAGGIYYTNQLQHLPTSWYSLWSKSTHILAFWNIYHALN